MIINPHFLVAVTTCIEALECPRKVYVRNLGAGEKLDRDSIKKTTLGNMLHSVFSNKISLGVDIAEAIDLTLEKAQIELLASDVGEKEAREYLQLNAQILNTLSIQGETEVDSQHWKYGMSGKFDALTENMIFELKSSRIPDIHPWPNHNIQMASYLKIMEQEGDYRGSIIYINEGEIGVKRPTHFPLNDILIARNYTYLVLSGKWTPPVLRGDEMRHCRRCYYQNGCFSLCSGLVTQRDCTVCYHESMCKKTPWTTHQIKYFLKFNKMLFFEEAEMLIDQYMYSRTVTSEKTRENLLQRGQIILTAGKEKETKMNGNYLSKYLHQSVLNRFRKGDMLRGYGLQKTQSNVTLFHSLIIREISQTEVIIESQNSLPDNLVLVPANIIHNIRTSRKALYKAIYNEFRLNKLIIHIDETELEQIEIKKDEITKPLKNYNPSQQKAIIHSLNTPDFMMIQGPAGTGKTSVIVEIINQLIMEKQSVLCTAYTNMAIDNIASKLKEHDIPFIRLGHLHSMDEEIHDFSSISQPEHFKSIMEKKQTGVVVATTSTISNQYYEELYFDFVLIDEAAQMTEPETLKPVILGNKAILVGDHAQLNPIVLSPDAIKMGLETSLFEKLASKFPLRFLLLDEQYRMNDQILSFPNRIFYASKLKSATTKVGSQAFDTLNGEILNSDPYQVIEVLDSNYDAQQVNISEGSIILQLIQEISSTSDVNISEIGIIAPFRAQVVYLRNLLPQFYIDTVDRFQGSEREIIIYSTTTTQEIPILINPKRMNVALTRARKKLVVLVTNPYNMQETGLLSKVYQDAVERDLLTQISSTRLEDFNQQDYISKNREMITKNFGLSPLPNWRSVSIPSLIHRTGIFYGTLELIEEEIIDDTVHCPICRSELDKGIQCIGCEYWFHKGHLLIWIGEKEKCPVCLHSLVTR